MITCYYSVISEWNDDDWKHLLASFPEQLRNDLQGFGSVQEQRLSAAGKYLLQKITSDNGKQIVLENIGYNPFLRPYFNGDFDFNIAHSGNIAGCVYLENGKAGLDIEEVRNVAFAEYESLFTQKEWLQITGNENLPSEFFRLWTRKEALIKAVGKGVYLDLQTIEVLNDVVILEGQAFYLSEINIAEGYKACIAANRKETNIICRQIKSS